ncbi:beta-lactamase-like protein [Gaertneriomyces semiglobifer]|nr:beta-lactamase-like protein [Gaertneriomyces semiglobifer]
MRYYLQIVGTDTVDASPTIVVHFDSQRYLFNCGEGTQRFAHEHKVRLAKIQTVFLTRVGWECVGGLPGMLLTLADAGTTELRLHGPPNLTHFMAATRHFIYRESLDLTTNEFHPSQGNQYKDENLVVRPVFLVPDTLKSEAVTSSLGDGNAALSRKRKSESRHDELLYKKAVLSKMFPSTKSHHPLSDIAVSSSQLPSSTISGPVIESDTVTTSSLVDEPATEVIVPRLEIGHAGANRLPRCELDTGVISYICEGPQVPGKFDPVTAKRLGVKAGKDFGILAKGESVTTSEGNVVRPEQVVGPAKPGSIFIILDCPSTAYIGSLLQSSAFGELAGSERVRCIVHIAGQDVIDDPRYVRWMRQFHPKTEHFIISRKHNPQQLMYFAAGNILHQLHALDSKVFPRPYYTNTAEIDLSAIPDLPVNTRVARPLTNFIIEPSPQIDESECLQLFDTKKVEQNTSLEVMSIPAELRSVEASRSENEWSYSEALEDISVVPLGTGAAIPGKYRNVSSTLVQMPDGYILLDAGEGTLGQIFRHFGTEMSAVIKGLKLVFVSHLHADHHLGVVRILKEWNRLREDHDRLVVLAPARYQIWLEEYSDCEDFGLDHIHIVDSAEVRFDSEKAAPTVLEENPSSGLRYLRKALSLASVQTVLVHHCAWAYALVLTTVNNTKVVFSGDCRPSQDLILAGKNATLVIHEATLEDNKSEEAVQKRHCTINEAVNVARGMNAQCLLLTHFSQRYPKLPIISEGMLVDGKMKIGIAYDLMRISLREFWRLPVLLKGLRALFPNAESEEENEL